MLALDADPEGRLRRTTDLYSTLRSYFSSSQYLPLVAMIFSGSVSTEESSGFAQKTRHIYNLMKRTHPYLTTSEDIVYSSLMALSGSDANQLIPDSERCFVLLKKKFFSKNAVQSLSNVLAICEGTSEQKCQKVLDIYDGLKVYGKKYGTDYELATLGVIASLPVALDQLVSDLSDVSDFLQSSKGYGFFGLGRKQGLMYAAMIVGGHYIDRNVNTTMQSVAVSGTISLIAAQQAAVIASVAAASAAASAASSSV